MLLLVAVGFGLTTVLEFRLLFVLFRYILGHSIHWCTFFESKSCCRQVVLGCIVGNNFVNTKSSFGVSNS